MAWNEAAPLQDPGRRHRRHAAGAPAAPAGRSRRRARQRHPGQARGQQPGRLGEGPAGHQHDPRAEERGEIRPGDTLIEATSGNTGIALAMAAAIRGYRMVLIMPEDLSIERAQTMKAFGAELILTPRSGGMEYARDLAEQMQRDGKGRVLDQFANADNPRVHYETTGPEIWADTQGRVTHFVSAMGTTGTITGVSRYLKEQNPAVRIVGAQPAEGSRIPASASGPRPTCPRSTTPRRWTSWCYVSQADAEDMARRLAREEGLFAGISAAGACWVALQIAQPRWRTPPSSSSSATAATATCPPGVFRHDASTRPASARTAPHRWPHHGRRGRRPKCGCAARPAAGRTGTTRRRCWPPSSMCRPGRARAAGAQRGLDGAHVRADHRLHGGRRDARGRHRARGGRRDRLETVTGARADRRLRLPAHEPGHHRLPRAGARRGPAVAGAGRVQAVRARRTCAAGAPARATRWPTGCVRAATSRSFIELPPRA
jgi:cysteine synthase B